MACIGALASVGILEREEVVVILARESHRKHGLASIGQRFGVAESRSNSPQPKGWRCQQHADHLFLCDARTLARKGRRIKAVCPGNGGGH